LPKTITALRRWVAQPGGVDRVRGIHAHFGGETTMQSHLDFSARWIHDFDVRKRVEGDGFNFTASLKF
jgi:hypothetical protein